MSSVYRTGPLRGSDEITGISTLKNKRHVLNYLILTDQIVFEFQSLMFPSVISCMRVHMHACVFVLTCMRVPMCTHVGVFLRGRSISFGNRTDSSGPDHRLSLRFPASLGNCPWLWVGITCFSQLLLSPPPFLESICISSLIMLEKYVLSVLRAPGAERTPS